ncbi:TIR domain-containing protein [Saccharothrix obliqua]|uniref:TIR domain-containing protein n=1 Tax=Saccharothrix obliqua TaxID=2861747 RepID=UPI001C5F0018|nr:TIR domain-containing protein [Saccharothrix obliqua]MBW4721590.1 TIR domain-containing protein [Saccharothrix obliqua]
MLDERPSAYDAFLSYSHAADGRLAPAVERGLHRLAKRWNQVRALRVFRDQTNLAASPDLWGTITTALDRSRFFILLASPEAAASPWVGREVSHWIEHRERETFLIVLTGGVIAWAGDDFDWDRTDALPPRLRGWFDAEPLWIDLSWAGDEAHLSLGHAGFRRALAALAAPIHGSTVDAIDSEDARQHRLGRRLRRSAVAGVALLLAVALVLSTLLWSRTEGQRTADQSRALAARSQAVGDRDPELARLLALAGHAVGPTVESRTAMLLAADRPGLAAMDGGQPVHALAVGARGTLMAGGTEVRRWDLATRREVAPPRPMLDGPVRTVVFSPDLSHLAVTSRRKVEVWALDERGEPRNPRIIATEPLDDPDRPEHRTVSFSPDGALLAISGSGHSVRLWDVRASRQVAHSDLGRQPPALTTWTSNVAFSPAGSLIATGGRDGKLWFRDATTLAPVGEPLTVDTTDHAAPALAFSPDGALLATASPDGVVRLWDTAARRPVGEPLTAPAAGRSSVAFSHDGRLLATGDRDGAVRLFDVDTRRQVGDPLTGHVAPVLSVAFAPDGPTLVSGDGDGVIRVWDVENHSRTADPLTGHPGPVHAAAFSPDSRFLATGGDYGRDFAPPARGSYCAERGSDVCVRGDGWEASLTRLGFDTGLLGDDEIAHLRTRVVDGPTVLLWDTSKRTAVGRFTTGDTRTVRSLAYSPDGSTLLVGGAQAGPGVATAGTVSTMDPTTGRVRIAAQYGPIRPVWSVAYSPDGRTVALASNSLERDADKATVHYWDPVSGASIRTALKGRTAYTTAFSPDGRTLAAGADDGTVYLWPVDGGDGVTLAHDGPVRSVAFSPDGRTLATAGADNLVWLWDVASRRRIGEPLTGHTGQVHAVAFSPDGELLASGGGDGSVRLWHVASRQRVGPTHLAHDGSVRAVAFSPDGTMLAGVGEDGSVRLWRAGHLTDVERALCGQVSRSLTAEEWAEYAPDVPHRQVCP